MQWPVYSLAEHGAQIIRDFHNGVPDPDDPSNSNNTPSGGSNSTNPSAGGGSDHSSGALSLPAPSVFTSVVALFFAALVVAL